MKQRIIPVLLSILMAGQAVPAALAAGSQPDVNFKIYSPTEPAKENNAAGASAETPVAPAVPEPAAQGQPDFAQGEVPVGDSVPPAADNAASAPSPEAAADTSTAAAPAAAEPAGGEPQKVASKVLQGYIRVVPSGTKIPIIMDTSVDSDTSQEGDEFSARTSEDLTIDGGVVVPAGSVIKGRIAQLNAPKRFDRSGSVALKFDTVTTPDNRQIPLVANIVARGGVVHAKRGMKDVLIETGMFTLPAAAGLGIGFLAGNASNSSGSVGSAGGALIGAGIGVAVGTIVLMSKKGKRVDVRPGDELKIELAEDLRMPM
jgi:hypothetical protein